MLGRGGGGEEKQLGRGGRWRDQGKEEWEERTAGKKARRVRQREGEREEERRKTERERKKNTYYPEENNGSL